MEMCKSGLEIEIRSQNFIFSIVDMQCKPDYEEALREKRRKTFTQVRKLGSPASEREDGLLNTTVFTVWTCSEQHCRIWPLYLSVAGTGGCSDRCRRYTCCRYTCSGAWRG
jgi:hypothetical protein